MLNELKLNLQTSIATFLKTYFPPDCLVPEIEMEIPGDKQHGEFSTNIALKSAKILKKPPMTVASEMVAVILAGIRRSPLGQKIQRVEVKQPGFINFYISSNAVFDILEEIFIKKDLYGSASLGNGAKVQIEFVSANPTGPLSVAHARQAAVGDALGNILRFLGFSATKEYYVNDEGNQINLLGESVRIQAQKLLTGQEPQEQLHYQGEYITDIARDFIRERKIGSMEDLLACQQRGEIRNYTVNCLMEVIRKELDDFGVHFDVWSHQSKIASAPQVAATLEELKAREHLYEKDGALWFKSTAFGDDKDRVVRKSDGTFTYLAPDIVYHKDKYRRGFEQVINIWGPDHHGYIPRIKAAVAALGHDPDSLKVLIVQLATISREGKPVSMSTRKGQYIQLREVMDEVGSDAARFFFLLRHLSAHLDFDLELAKKESPENPVFYIQYAYARIHSIFKKAEETGLPVKRSGFGLLKEDVESDLIKTLGYFPDILKICWQELDPYALVIYLVELATAFHKFYDSHRVVNPECQDLSSERLGLIEATRIVLANGLGLLGISRPQQM